MNFLPPFDPEWALQCSVRTSTQMSQLAQKIIEICSQLGHCAIGLPAQQMCSCPASHTKRSRLSCKMSSIGWLPMPPRCEQSIHCVFFLREGTIKIGDRLLAINGVKVTQCTLSEALSLLRNSNQEARFLIEYDVSVLGAHNYTYHEYALQLS